MLSTPGACHWPRSLTVLIVLGFFVICWTSTIPSIFGFLEGAEDVSASSTCSSNAGACAFSLDSFSAFPGNVRDSTCQYNALGIRLNL